MVADAGIAIGITHEDEIETCPPPESPGESKEPVLTIRKTAKDRAEILLDWEFPADVPNPRVVIQTVELMDAKGRFTPAEVLGAWGGDDPEILSNGPFNLHDVALPTPNRQVQVEAVVRYGSETKSCLVRKTAFAALDCDDCGARVGDPVTLVDGNMRFVDVDPLPPLLELTLTRTFDSGHGVDGFFGIGWTTVFDQAINFTNTSAGTSIIHFTTPENQAVAFAGEDDQIWPTNVTLPSRLYFSGDSVYYRPPQARYETAFGESGFFAGLRDTYTNAQLEVVRHYGLGGETLTGMTVRDFRTGGTWEMTITDNLVRSIVSSSGTWTYVYDTNGYLKTVEGPDGPWRSYTYGTGGITEVRDGAGYFLETHQYDAQGRAITSFGPSDEIANIEYEQPASDGSLRRLVTMGGGAVIETVIAPVGRAFRPVSREGGCSSCGTRDEVVSYDSSGRVVRRQDASGYITTNAYDGAYVRESRIFLRPANCDPSSSPTQCALTPAQLADEELIPTTATITTTFAYDDTTWPDRPTAVTTTSVGTTNEIRTENRTYDPTTGQTLTNSITGWTGYPSTIEETHVTTTSLYDGLEGPAFDPGSWFGWMEAAQPTLPKSIDGPRTDVSDITAFVYYPDDSEVPPAERGRIAATRNAVGHITRFENYDDFGNARRVTDANGVVTEVATDSIGRPFATTLKGVSGCNSAEDPLCDEDITVTRTYDDLGPLISEERPGGGVTTYGYDSRGRTNRVSRGPSVSDQREALETAYDPGSGKKAEERYLAFVEGNWVEKKSEAYDYDGEGRLTTVTHADDSELRYSYDPSGRIATLQDENHDTPNVFYSYDPAGRLTTVQQRLDGAPGNSVTTSYEYDAHGNLTEVTDPNGNETVYRFDDFGRLLRQQSPVSGLTTYGYDAGGNLTASIDANGATTARTYDAIGRVSTASSTKSGDTDLVSWFYDSGAFGIGRLHLMTDPVGETSYSYDRRGLLLREARSLESTEYVTGFGYDADGNRSRMIYPSGRVVDYTFDYADRPYSVSTATASIVTSAAYLPFGPISSIVYGNGTTRTISHDQRYQTSINELTTPAGPLARYAYAHDDAGNVIELHDELTAAYNRNFRYDDLNRLTHADTGAALWGTGTYSYDSMGNLVSRHLGTSSTELDYSGTLPKLTSVDEDGVTSSVFYDDVGNEIAVGTSASDYSPRNHLSGTPTFTYAYDGRGIRNLTSHPSYYLSAASAAPTKIYRGENATGTITLGGPAPAGGAIVQLSASSAAITMPSTVTIAEGSASTNFSITQNATPISGEVIITVKYGVSRKIALTIEDEVAIASVAVDPSSVVGGQPSEGTITLGAAAPAEGALVQIALNGTAASAPSTVLVSEGQTGATFVVTTVPVASPADITVSATYGRTRSAQLQVAPASIDSVALDPASIAGGGTVTGQVLLDGPAPVGGLTVELSTTSPALTSVPASVVVPEGQSSQTFVIATQPVVSITEVTIEASLRGTGSAVLTLTPCVFSTASSPTLGEETVWFDDELPAGATLYDQSQWMTTQHASGTHSLTRPTVVSENVVGVLNASATMLALWDQSFALYILTDACSPPTKLLAHWRATDGIMGQAAWGQPVNGHVYMGALPTPGVWTRVTVPIEALHLAGKAIDTFYFYSYGGQAWIDRLGTTGTGCSLTSPAAPTIPADDTVWVDDDLPSGVSLESWVSWDTSQKASGTRSITMPETFAPARLTILSSGEMMSPVDGESVAFYAKLHDCATPKRLKLDLNTSGGGYWTYGWGVDDNGDPLDAPLPTPGGWTRYEVPASTLGIEHRSINVVSFEIDAGQIWIDHIGLGAFDCSPAVAAAPSPGSETVWVEDALPAGATMYGSVTHWDQGQKASGTQSLTQPPADGEKVVAFEHATATLPVGWGDELVFYTLLSECTTPTRMLAQWMATDGTWGGATWGQTSNGHVHQGAMPAAGSWSRLAVSAAALQLENKSIESFYLFVYDGQAWVDRIGKAETEESCILDTASSPTIAEGDRVWMEDELPTGTTFYPPMDWDTSQKAGGTRSLRTRLVYGPTSIGLSNPTTTISPIDGESLVFYALLHECATPQSLKVRIHTSDAYTAGYTWGAGWEGGEPDAPLPAAGNWVRYEIAAEELGLEYRHIDGIEFFIDGGQIWVDHIGVGPASCYATLAATPEYDVTETVWFDDTVPSGASSSVNWDAGQKASGTLSMTKPPASGRSEYSVLNATSTMPVGWDETLTFYMLINDCDPPSQVFVQWVATDNSWAGASWGEAVAGHLYMGDLPTAGTWARIEIPAGDLLLEGTAIKSFAMYVTDGQAWFDRVGKMGAGCFPAPAAPPSLGADTVWVEDSLPAGATMYGSMPRWETGQKASGAQSLTRPARAGDNAIGFINATSTMTVATGDDLVFYMLFNECATPPNHVFAQWIATDGSWGGATWGTPMNEHVYGGSLPAAGTWSRMAVSAAALNLEGKSIKSFVVFVFDGQAWIDRIGTGTSSGSARTIRPEASRGVLERLRSQFDPWRMNTPVSLSIQADFIETNSEPLDARRISLYTPEMQLMAETETTTAASPAIENEYIWFAGEPAAQVSATGDVFWYFNDHLGTPILQTDATANIVWRVEREPYGARYQMRAGAAKHQPLAFPGQEDDGDDTAYNIFRWYRAGWGRYTQGDPIGLMGGLNLYNYAGKSPANRTDPLGLFSWLWGPGAKTTPSPSQDCGGAATKVACTKLLNVSLECTCSCLSGQWKPQIFMMVDVDMSILNLVKRGMAKDPTIVSFETAVDHEVDKHIAFAAAAVEKWAKSIETPMSHHQCKTTCNSAKNLDQVALGIFKNAWNQSQVVND